MEELLFFSRLAASSASLTATSLAGGATPDGSGAPAPDDVEQAALTQQVGSHPFPMFTTYLFHSCSYRCFCVSM
jgi:hypothetical protein